MSSNIANVIVIVVAQVMMNHGNDDRLWPNLMVG